MTHFRQRFALLLLTLTCFTSAEDPRPRILILGESSSMPIRGSLPWTGVLTREHPEWRVINLSEWDGLVGENLEVPHKKKTKTLPGWSANLETNLKDIDGADLVIVMLGLNHSRKEILEKIPPVESAEGLRSLLKKGKAHPKTKDAAWAVVTPLPIVPSRLDQWSTASFSESVEPNQELARLWQKVAEEENAAIIDAQAWVKEQGNGGDAVMTAGWMVRWNGIDKLGAWMTQQIEALNPQPQDAYAFAAWKEVQAAHAVLDAVLEQSGGGQPATGVQLTAAPLPEVKTKKKIPPQRFEIPLTALEPGLVSILVESAGPHLATMGTGSDSFARPYLELKLASGDTQTLNHQGTNWQYISEQTPDAPLSDRRFGVSIGKWRPMILVDGREGQVRKALLRWELPLFSEGQLRSVTLVIPDNGRRGYMKEEFDGKANELKSPGTYGPLRVHMLTRPDSLWDSSVATWNSRNGTQGWTGGDVDTAMRQKEVREFLKTDPPAEVRARAEALMP